MQDEYDFSTAKRGAVVPLPESQTEVRLRLDNKVLDWLRERVNEAGGGSYHEMLNAILRTYIQAQEDAALLQATTEGERARAGSAAKKSLPCFRDASKPYYENNTHANCENELYDPN